MSMNDIGRHDEGEDWIIIIIFFFVSFRFVYAA